jgi:regulator of ribosome biosynthesis
MESSIITLLDFRLIACPTEQSDVGPLVILPSEEFRLPRSKKIHEADPETKWEKFAREKGIKNKKRERMLFDESAQEYKPRFGYKRAKNGIEDMPIVEIKKGQDPFKDPWEASRKAKKERVDKNLKQQLKNKGKLNPKKYGKYSTLNKYIIALK